jgi:S-methylmethionine-dependent homocysteine/selenocysteine methylase
MTSTPHDFRLLDGGTGTELRRRGVALSNSAWSGLAALTHYELLRAIHVDYIDAGADIVTTNTFGTSRFVLAAAGYERDFAVINTRSVAAARAARDAADRAVAIAGSISCLPPCFDARGYPSEANERAAYRELAETLVEAGVDLLLLEMMQETRHAPLALEAARVAGLPVWLGLSCRLGVGGALVGYDFPLVPLGACLDVLLPLEPDAIVVMHSPLDAVVPALREIRLRHPGLLGAYPELGDGSALPAVSAADFVAQAREWLAAGARIIGGCCGTTPAHIRALAAARSESYAGRGIGPTSFGTR